MFEGFSLGLIAAAIFGVADLLAVAVARKLSLLRVLLWTHLAALVIGFPYLLLATDVTEVTFTHWLLLGGISVMFLGTLTSFYKSLQTGPVALISPIVSAHLVIVILLSTLLLGERLESVQSIGIMVAMAGIVMATMTVQRGQLSGPGMGQGVFYALITMVGAGIFIFSVGAFSKEYGWFLPIYLVRAFSFVILLGIQRFSAEGSWWHPVPKMGLAAAGIGVLQFIGLSAYASGAQVGSISLVAATFSVYPLIPMVGGVVLLHERIVLRQAAGLAAVLSGLLVLGMTS